MVPPEAGDGLADVYLTVAVRTSAGPGPWPVRVPRDEANRIISARHGVAGTQPPRNFTDGGQAGPVTRSRGVRQPGPGAIRAGELGG